MPKSKPNTTADCGIDFAAVNVNIRNMQQPEYMKLNRELWALEYNAEKVDEMAAINERGTAFAVSMMRHFQAEFEAEPFDTKQMSANMYSFLIVMFHSCQSVDGFLALKIALEQATQGCMPLLPSLMLGMTPVFADLEQMREQVRQAKK